MRSAHLVRFNPATRRALFRLRAIRLEDRMAMDTELEATTPIDAVNEGRTLIRKLELHALEKHSLFLLSTEKYQAQHVTYDGFHILAQLP